MKISDKTANLPLLYRSACRNVYVVKLRAMAVCCTSYLMAYMDYKSCCTTGEHGLGHILYPLHEILNHKRTMILLSQ